MCEMLCCTASASNPTTRLTHLPFIPARQVGQPEGRSSCNSYIPSYRRHKHSGCTKNLEKLVQRAGRWALASSPPVALGSISPVVPQNSVHWCRKIPLQKICVTRALQLTLGRLCQAIYRLPWSRYWVRDIRVMSCGPVPLLCVCVCVFMHAWGHVCT